jgi:hypothetical protein
MDPAVVRFHAAHVRHLGVVRIHRRVPCVAERFECADVIEVGVREHDAGGRGFSEVAPCPAPDSPGGTVEAGVNERPSIFALYREQVHEQDAHTHDTGGHTIERNRFRQREGYVFHGVSLRRPAYHTTFRQERTLQSRRARGRQPRGIAV